MLSMMSVSSKTLGRSHLVKIHLFRSQQANTYSLAWVGTGAHIWTNNCSWRRDYSHSFGLVRYPPALRGGRENKQTYCVWIWRRQTQCSHIIFITIIVIIVPFFRCGLDDRSWFIPNDAAREFAVFPTMYIFPMRVCYIRENLSPLLQKQSYGERLSDVILAEPYKGSIQIP